MNRIPGHLLPALWSACFLLAGALLPPDASAEPRLPPVDESTLNDAQRAIAETLADGLTNATATLLHNPILAADLLPFQRFIEERTSLAPRHRELLALRTAWLCRSDYVWAAHVPSAERAGLSPLEIERVAGGPDDAAWSPFESALLRAADELHVDTFVSDTTWSALSERYSVRQMLDMLFTVGEFTMIAGTLNSLRVEPDAHLDARLPDNAGSSVSATRTDRRLVGMAPRVAPIERSDWTPAMRQLLDPNDTGRPVANVYRTYVHNLEMDLLRRNVSEHIRDRTTLTDRQREILLLRIGVLGRAEYEWAAHVRIARRIGMTDAELDGIVAGADAGGWDRTEEALLRATDELVADDMVSDATWSTLEAYFDAPQLLDILTTVGGYRMLSMAMNSLGIQLDANMADFRFPPELR